MTSTLPLRPQQIDIISSDEPFQPGHRNHWEPTKKTYLPYSARSKPMYQSHPVIALTISHGIRSRINSCLLKMKHWRFHESFWFVTQMSFGDAPKERTTYRNYGKFIVSTCFYCLQIDPNGHGQMFDVVFHYPWYWSHIQLLRFDPFRLNGSNGSTFEALPPGESLQALVSGFSTAMPKIRVFLSPKKSKQHAKMMQSIFMHSRCHSISLSNSFHFRLIYIFCVLLCSNMF